MKKLIITLEIEDAEIVKDYQEIHPDLIMDDLRDGSLIEYCQMVRVELQNV